MARGGARPGSGPKRIYSLNETQLRAMLKSAKAKAKESGQTIDEILLDVIYGDLPGDVPLKDRMTAIALWKKFTMATHQESKNENVKAAAPVILPERRPDPGKIVQLADKKKANE